MSKEDVVREIEKSIVESQEIVNNVASVVCYGCDELVDVDPATLVPEDEGAVEWQIEPFDEVEPTEVRVYCSVDCKESDQWGTI